ncbi:hypothetical protein CUN41_07550 [Enterococcus faecium]|nr:hypothetical protein CUN41_07550 [Enterococcus faecium]
MLIVKAIYYFFHCFAHYDPTTFSASNEVLNWQKNRLSLSDSLLNVELSAFLLFRSVCVFETVFFVETVHTSVCLCEFLTSSVEWM